MYEQKATETKNPALLKLIKPKWTGTIAYRGLVDVEKLKRVGGGEHRAIKDPMMVIYIFCSCGASPLPAHEVGISTAEKAE
jgi:hypothetical protein